MKKNIFLGALPMNQSAANSFADSDIQSGGSVYSPAPSYSFEKLDVVADSPQPLPPDVAKDGGSMDVKKEVAEGDVVNPDVPKDNEGGKFALSAPVIIGAAALIYFFFLRKKK